MNRKEYQKQYRAEHKEKSSAYQKIYRLENKNHLAKLQKEWNIKNKEYRRFLSKKQYIENRERILEYSKKRHQIKKEYYSEYGKKWASENKELVSGYRKKWRLNNPRSGSGYSYDLQDAMNNVRQRDNNTCQWLGCGLTHRDTPIHVHHIFPRNEYPDLELVEQYMICYCANHHGLWHRYRGDCYANLISRQKGVILL